MELRFVLEHTEAGIEVARKLFNLGDRSRCVQILDDLGLYLTEAKLEGYLPAPNIDVKPTEPGG